MAAALQSSGLHAFRSRLSVNACLEWATARERLLLRHAVNAAILNTPKGVQTVILWLLYAPQVIVVSTVYT